MAEEVSVKKIDIKDFDITKWEELLHLVYPVVSQIFVIEDPVITDYRKWYRTGKKSHIYTLFNEKFDEV